MEPHVNYSANENGAVCLDEEVRRCIVPIGRAADVREANVANDWIAQGAGTSAWVAVDHPDAVFVSVTLIAPDQIGRARLATDLRKSS